MRPRPSSAATSELKLTRPTVTTYVSRPPLLTHPLTKFARRHVAVIYLSDVFGIELLQNKL